MWILMKNTVLTWEQKVHGDFAEIKVYGTYLLFLLLKDNMILLKLAPNFVCQKNYLFFKFMGL